MLFRSRTRLSRSRLVGTWARFSSLNGGSWLDAVQVFTWARCVLAYVEFVLGSTFFSFVRELYPGANLPCKDWVQVNPMNLC